MVVRIGLAGLGVHGYRYAQHLLRGDVPGARLSVICRRDEEAGRSFAREHDLRFVGIPEELATVPGVDAVVLVLPPDLHPRAAEACLASRRPVLVEKPLAPDLRSASAIAQEVQKTGTLLMVAQTLRFDAVVEALRLEARKLDSLRIVSVNQRFEPVSQSWIDTPGPGGIMLNTGVHGFDLLRHLTGLEAEAVWAECGSGVTRETEDQFVAMIRLEPGGVLAVLDNARTTDSRSGRIELVGAGGQVWGDHIHRTLHRVRGREVSDLGPVAPSPTLPATLQSFVRSVVDQSTPPVTAADGLAAVEMVEAARLSARRGRRVTLDEVRRVAGPD